MISMTDTPTTAEDARPISDIEKELHAPEELNTDGMAAELPTITRDEYTVWRERDGCPGCGSGEMWKAKGSPAVWCINPDCQYNP